MCPLQLRMELRGEDFDKKMDAHIVEKLKRINFTSNPRALRRLRTACERGTCLLSGNSDASIEIGVLFEGIDFYSKIIRAKYEKNYMDLFRSTLEHIERSLNNAKMNKSSLHDVISVGGSTRIPQIQILRDIINGVH
ncbi:heat shock 70 kDa protein cognate 4 [Nephila pilipes]|uniref:Heat shock 70 kDa protein cognate 4 n=1 Tax=Nephila pilipes TaxID=299642 RepID=A0A8X6P8X2_NEPPI|nr:heat shock 70 kDa protein cognate 4 [Nephila pilipes]